MPRSSFAARLNAALRIHREIASGRYPNAKRLGAILEVSSKTARSYLALLPDVFKHEPIYDAQRHGYFYRNPASNDPIPRLKADEVVALFLLEEATKSLRNSPVQSVLESALDKLTLMLPPSEGLSVEEVSNALSWRVERAPSVNESVQNSIILQDLYSALLGYKRVKVEYHGRERQKRTRRKIDPIHLTRCEGQWYLVAYCHLRKSIRTFVPARILEVELLEESFQPPKEFNPQAHFRSAFGIVAGYRVSRVVIQFTPKVAPVIRERHWHPTQELKELPDGGVRLSMTCSQGDELRSWLLGWGDQITIKTPTSLAREIAKAHYHAWKGVNM